MILRHGPVRIGLPGGGRPDRWRRRCSPPAGDGRHSPDPFARRVPRAAALGLLIAGALAGPAPAFDLLNPFGLFGSSDKVAPATAEGIAYRLTIDGAEDDKDLLRALQDVSALHRLPQEPPPDGEGLVRRVEADLPRLTDALWGRGYYDGRVAIRVDGVSLDAATIGSAAAAAAARGAERFRGRAPVPVTVVLDRGTLFRLSPVTVLDAAANAPFAPVDLPPRVVRLDRDEPARSSTAVALEARLVDHFRARGHPFAKVVRRDPLVDHRTKTLALTLAVDPGPLAGLGTVAVRGAPGVDPAVVRSFIYTEPGEPYSPRAVADLRRSIARIEALGSVRVREGEALDAEGNLPLLADITERPPRVVGVSARYSTVDGPGVRASWAHRNLFGGAERLRLEADLFFTEEGGSRFDAGRGRRGGDLDWSHLGARFAASFLKPALGGTRNDLLIDAFVAREATEGYTSRAAGATAALRHRFSDTFAVQGGVEVEAGQASDALGRLDYTLVGLPVALTYDSTDSLLDPTRGIRLTASATPYPALLGSDPGLVVVRGQASTYYALDEEARTVLAGRIGFGSITGASLADIPANRRFFAGGGGSVRGFEYKTLGPKDPFGEPLGGRSLLEGSVEARIKVTDTIGLVPFLDAGTAFASSFPDAGERLRVAAGLGLRYQTGIGPIRLDVAVPLNRERGESAAAVYIGLGQAF